MGLVLGMVLTPAIFWNRGRVWNLVLGGAGFGSAVGVLSHLGQSFTEGQDVKPEGMRDQI